MKRILLSILSIIILCFVASHAWGRVLKGKVTDAETGAPMAGCSVYINFSTIGTVTNGDGLFILNYYGPFPIDLVFQLVGYRSQTVNVVNSHKGDFNIALSIKEQELEEVNVRAGSSKGWGRYGKDFMEAFTGYSNWDCKLINKEVLSFRYDKDLDKLYVHASAPLILKHKQLGYTIYYDLIDFSRSYRNKTVFFTGSARYEDIPSRNKKKQERILANRLSAYKGSVNHFIRSVYTNTYVAEGFEVRKMERINSKDYGRYVPVWTDTLQPEKPASMFLLQASIAAIKDVDSNQIAPLFVMIRKWMQSDTVNKVVHLPLPLWDTLTTTVHHYFLEKTDEPGTAIVKYYNYNRLSPEDSLKKFAMSDMKLIGKEWYPTGPKDKNTNMMDLVYGTILPADSFRIAVDSPEIALHFDKFLQVVYKYETEEWPYIKRKSPLNIETPKPQRSVISLKNPERRISIQNNGNYMPPYMLFLEGYWSYEKLDKQLPMDYKPEDDEAIVR